MNSEQAKQILGDDILPSGHLYSLGRYLSWEKGDKEAILDAQFTADELEAIAWWMKNTKE